MGTVTSSYSTKERLLSTYNMATEAESTQCQRHKGEHADGLLVGT